MSVYHVEADGDTARALTYHTCHQAPLEDPAHVTAKIGQYHDELRRDGDVWRIGRREMRSPARDASAAVARPLQTCDRTLERGGQHREGGSRGGRLGRVSRCPRGVRTPGVEASSAIDVLLELCRLRIATLLGCEAVLTRRTPAAAAAGLGEATVGELPTWPTSDRFGPRERACLAFCEQFVLE